MAPISEKVTTCREESSQGTVPELPAGERVVISGMAGLYPKAYHVKDLTDILYNKVNPVTENCSRWDFKHTELTGFTGKVPDLNHFDAQFFKIHYMLANSMDVMNRKILEQAYAAIYDSGMNLDQLNGTKVGVYVSSSFSETESIDSYNVKRYTKTSFAITGWSKAMFANRISYWLNSKGPSVYVDQSCCSSTAALELAYNAILRGDCESAIVGACSLCLHPHSLIHYGRILKSSKDGKTKSFDENADGSVKSEAINVLFLQKAKDALRIYAEIINVKNEFSLLSDKNADHHYSFYRNPSCTTDFLKRFYEESKVLPQDVEYIEGCGSAIPEIDKAELEVYEEVFCKKRNYPLLVGSVTSNVGNVTAASGITAITKILLGYHTSVLAANLNCESPRSDIVALRDGRMAIVNEHMPCGQGYMAVNGCSVNGVSSHVLLKGHNKSKNPTRYKSRIPHLVLVSGRQETAVDKILKDLISRPIDPEEIALLNNAHGNRTSGHLGRGYVILDKNKENETVSLSEKVDYFDYVKRPVWFVYSGMGSQYNGMGTHLMRIPVFANTIERCNRVLKPKGLDIVHIITSPDETIFNNILHSFVGIAAIQIGLTDVLRELGIVPDKIIGHSVGELGCAYGDGCFTAEEMILSAYSRGLVSIQTSFIHGSMAAIGIGYQRILPMCPPEIEVACHNSSQSCTISGPSEVVQEFVASLVDKGIFAKEVPCSNIAYHSRYIAHAGPDLLKYLKEVIDTPKLRSERWVSTSVPMDKWDEPSAKYSSAEYYTNNLLNTVLFEETSCLIPPNAILLEIAPHGLMQSILKRSLPNSCTNIALMRRGYRDNAVFLLEAIGKLYMEGLNPKIQALYPKIEFPVSTGTPMLSHLIEWAHQEKWTIPLYLSASKNSVSETNIIITLHDEEHKYLRGHVIGGKILYPFAAVLVAVWDTLAMMVGVEKRKLAVRFRDVMLHVQPIMHDRRQLNLGVTLQRGTGRFEVIDDMNSNVACGFISIKEKKNRRLLREDINTQYTNVTSNEIYDHLFFRGFAYEDSFKSIHSTNLSLTEARIQWCGNWVTFIDGILQLNNLRHSRQSYSHPKFISKLSITPDEQDKYEGSLKTASVLETYNKIKCGGVIMENVVFDELSIPVGNSTTLRTLKFIPHFSSNQFDFDTIIQVYMQIVAENVGTRSLNITGVYSDNYSLTKFHKIKAIMELVPEVTTVYTWLNIEDLVKEEKNMVSEANLIVTHNLGSDDYMCQTLYKILENNTFVINLCDSMRNITRSSALYQVVCNHSIHSSSAVELSRWRSTHRAAFTSVISVHSSSDFARLIQEINSLCTNQNLLIMTTYPAIPGLKDILNQSKNGCDRNIRLVMNNNHDEGFDDTLFNKDLVIGIIRNGIFGGEYFVPLHNLCNAKGNLMLHSPVGQIGCSEWVQTSVENKADVTVKVHYAALNDLDVKRYTGLIPFNTICNGYGMDFSGTISSGTRVMGLVRCGAASTFIHPHPYLLWPVPQHWTLEDAATVPFAYCFAYYCLAIKCTLYPGMSVLVHGGAGGLGQALISLALANHCEVFATVSDVRKKQYLLKMYPKLKGKIDLSDAAENIGNSCDLTFSNLIMNATNGVGVDVVVSNVTGELKSVSIACVAALGVILDVSQIPTREYFEYGMYNMTKSRSYKVIDFFSIFNESEIMMKKLQRLVSEGIAMGWVHPLSRVTYGPADVARAFKLLATNNNRGRVLLSLQEKDFASLHAQPRLQCSFDKLHVIISDHGGFGQQMTDFLISRGVHKIHLNLPASSEHFKLKMRQWENLGVRVCCTRSDAQDVSGLLADYSSDYVEGIYILLTNKERPVAEAAAYVDAIDAICRKLFADLKYFAVINTANSAGEESCKSRNVNRFVATMLRLPDLRDVTNNNKQDQVSVRQATELVERAITSEEFVVYAHIISKPSPSLVHQISEIAGTTITRDVRSTTALSDLGIDLRKAHKVSMYLRDTYKIFLTVEAVNDLTMERIQYIEDTLTKVDFRNDTGLHELFTYIDVDEIVATAEMVFMPTLARNTTWSDEFDLSSPYLCIVPGIEGHYGRFRAMCERLKLPALVLQPDFARSHESIPEMARRYAEMLSQTADPKKHFYLLGYEIGVFVTLEMAAILEEKGFTTLVFCIGNPDTIHTEIKEHLKGLEKEEMLQNAIIRHMFIKMSNSGIDERELALERVSSWQKKLNVTVNTLLGKVPYSAQYTKQLIVAAYERLISLLQYEVKVPTLHSQLIILHTTPVTALQQTSLQRYSQRSVITHELRAPLSQALEDLRCASIVNAHLDSVILEEFEKKNFCESYVMESNKGITWSYG